MTSSLDNPAYCMALFEAQLLLGHVPASEHYDHDGRTILGYSWDEDRVRQVLHVPLTPLGGERVLALELAHRASFSFNVAPVSLDEHGEAQEIEGWQDRPRDEWGGVNILPQGVLRFAALYGRPYVRCSESPALVAPWRLVQAEAAARLHEPVDDARFAREWPERWAAWQAWQQQYGDERRGGTPDPA